MNGALRPCAQPGCSKLQVRGKRFCEKHDAENFVLETNREKGKGRYRLTPWSHLYNLAIWNGVNGLRRMCLRRDPICKICNHNISTVADHIVPHRGDYYGLFANLENLQGLCEQCHNEKTAREDGGFGRNPATAGTSGFRDP